MSDGAISQDEIEALLAGVAVDGLDNSGHVGGSSTVTIDTAALTKFAGNLKDPLLEKINSATGAGFTNGDPVAASSERDKLLAVLPEVVVAVYADFAAPFKGDHLYLLTSEFAQKIVNLILKEENADLDSMALKCISEFVTNQTENEIAELAKTGKFAEVSCNQPEAVNNPKAMIRMPQGNFALFTYPVMLDGQTYNLWEAIGGEAVQSISSAYAASGSGAQEISPADFNFDINAPDPSKQSAAAGGAAQPVNQAQPVQNQMPQMNGGMQMQQPQMNMGMNQMQMNGMNQMGMNQMQMPQMNMGMNQMGMGMQQMGMGMNQMGMMMPNQGFGVPNVQTLQYPNLQSGSQAGEQGNIGLIMDVNMEMTVELGRCKKQIKDILAMGEGTIIELEKLAGEPVDILVNHKPIAKGEVVVIDENFGVRVTEILSPLERVSDLR